MVTTRIMTVQWNESNKVNNVLEDQEEDCNEVKISSFLLLFNFGGICLTYS